MFLRCLKFAGIRNLAAQTVVPGAGVNLLVGGNGAGKTSLLEAVFLLARGRSFRTQALIQWCLGAQPTVPCTGW